MGLVNWVGQHVQLLQREQPRNVIDRRCPGHHAHGQQDHRRRVGYAVEELIGQPVTMVVHADDRAGLERHFADCLRRPGEVLRWEFRKIRKDGSLLWVRKAVRAVRNSEGQFDIVIVCENVTERKRIEDALTQTRQLTAARCPDRKNRFRCVSPRGG